MIPKIVHYCWFGNNPMPLDVQKRIDDWKEILFDYDFMFWNEETFNVHSHPYTSQAYECNKFAYVTDYVRLYALKYHGGIYMDTDVDVVKSLDPLLESSRAFTGCESGEISVTGTMAAEKDHPWINELLSHYENLNFIENGKMRLEPNTRFITMINKNSYNWIQQNTLQRLKNDVVIYPFDYLCAKDWSTGEILISDNTFTIHNFSGSWLSPRQNKMRKIKGKIKIILREILGEDIFGELLNKKRKM